MGQLIILKGFHMGATAGFLGASSDPTRHTTGLRALEGCPNVWRALEGLVKHYFGRYVGFNLTAMSGWWMLISILSFLLFFHAFFSRERNRQYLHWNLLYSLYLQSNIMWNTRCGCSFNLVQKKWKMIKTMILTLLMRVCFDYLEDQKKWWGEKKKVLK